MTELIRVLLLDRDEETIGDICHDLGLYTQLLQVTAVSSPHSLNEILHTGSSFHIVVTNLQLGWAQLRHVLPKLRQTWPTVPIILYTAERNARTVGSYFNLGVTHYAPKPHANELLRVIQTVLYQQEATRDSDPHASPSPQQIKNLTHLLDRQALELRELFNMAVSLSETLNPTELMSRLYQHICALFRPETFIAVFYDEQNEVIEVALALEMGEPMPLVPHGLRLPLAQAGVTGWVIQNRQAIFLPDLTMSTPPPVPLARLSQNPPRTWLGTPLVVGQRVVGAISLQSHEPYAYDENDQRVVETLSTFLALAVDNANHFQAEARRRLGAEALVRLATAVIQDNQLDEILTSIIQAVVAGIPDISSCRVSLFEDEMKTVHLVQGWVKEDETGAGRHEPFMRQGRVSIDKAVLVQRALAQEQPLLIYDLREELLTGGVVHEHIKETVRQKLRSLLYVPMRVHGRVVGMLHLNVNQTPRYFSEREVNLCQSIANYGAVALQNAQLRQTEEEQSRLAETLRALGSLLTSEYTLEAVYERIFDLLAQVVQYDFCTIQLYNPRHNQLYLAAVRGFADVELVKQVVAELGGEYVWQIMAGEQPYRVVPHVQTDPTWVKIPGFDFIHSSINCLLRVKDRVIGILNVDRATDATPYTEETARIVLAFANQAAIALENARLYGELHQRVQELSIINQVTMVSTRALYLDELLEQTTAVLAAQRFPYYVGFYLVDEVGRYLVPHPSFHTAPGYPFPERVALNIHQHALSQVAQKRGVQVHDPTPLLQPFLLYQISLPLQVNEVVVGLMTVGFVEGDEMLSEDDTYFLQTVAGQLSTAVQRASLYEDAQLYAAQLADKIGQRTAELQAAKDRTQAILDTAGEGIFFTDTNGRILYANEAITSQSGYLVNELIGQQLFDFYQRGHTAVPEVLTTLQQQLRTNQVWRGELDCRQRDGTPYTVSVNLTPLADSLGAYSGFVIVQADVTHLKEVERLKTQFVSNVSHELRTPLTNLKTYLTLLRRGKPEKAPRYLDVLDHETDRLAKLIHDLLDLSRLDTESTVMNLQPVSLTAVVQEMMAALRAQASQYNHTILWSSPDSDPLPTLADSEHLPEAINRLVTNAFVYTPAGGQISLILGQEEITKESEMPETATPMLYLRVQDNGLGLSAEDEDHLFERFFRGTAAQEMRQPGTGLGLVIAQEIVHRHHGRVAGHPNPDQGTTFTIWLPRAN